MIPKVGTKYKDEYYMYSFGQAYNAERRAKWENTGVLGWGVKVIKGTILPTIAPPIKTEIDGYPVTHIDFLFMLKNFDEDDPDDFIAAIDVSNVNTENVISMRSLFEAEGRRFSYFSEIIGLASINTSNVIDMSNMFNGCELLSEIDLSHFDTSKVTNMAGMFEDCSNLQTIDVSHFDTSKVTLFYSMFSGCSELTSIDLSSFDTSNATTMECMFFACEKLKKLDVSSFDTSKVETLAGMFYLCGKIKALDIKNFDTSNVIDYDGMFEECGKLESLNIEGFRIKESACLTEIFSACHSLRHLFVHSEYERDILAPYTTATIEARAPYFGASFVENGVEYRFGLRWTGAVWETPQLPVDAWGARLLVNADNPQFLTSIKGIPVRQANEWR